MIRFALVGCGRIAKKHAEILASGSVKDATLVAVCDRDGVRAESFGEKYKVPHYTDMHTMMEKLGSSVDVVAILTDSGSHAANCIALAKYGKHIVVEKPMALTIEDGEQMIRACDSAGVRLFVVKQNRYNLPVQRVRMALDNGRFGKLVMGTVRVRWCRTQEYYNQDAWRGTWEHDGGVIANQASHHVDLLTWMMGDVESVFAYTATRLLDIEVDDTAVAVLKFTNGALGVFEATNATRPINLEGSLSILGETGTAEIAGFAVNEMKTWEFANRTAEDDEVLAKYRENPPNVYGFGHQRYLTEVVQAIQQGKGGVVDGLEGLKTLTLMHAMYESMELGREVTLRFRGRHSPLGHRSGAPGISHK